MPKSKKHPDDELEKMASALRGVFQDVLKSFVRTKADREDLARILNRSIGHVNKMLYAGEGGLDVWAKAFAHFYKLDLEALRALRHELKLKHATSPADKVWLAIKNDFDPPPDQLAYIANVAYEACRIKAEIDEFQSKKPQSRPKS